MEYPNRTDQELRQLALDVIDGRALTSAQVPDDMMVMVFLPLALADADMRKALLDLPIGLLYEEIDKAGPRSVNGYPMFTSMQILSQPDMDRFHDFLKEAQEISEEIEQRREQFIQQAPDYEESTS